jgi:hypothetical protein
MNCNLVTNLTTLFASNVQRECTAATTNLRDPDLNHSDIVLCKGKKIVKLSLYLIKHHHHGEWTYISNILDLGSRSK